MKFKNINKFFTLIIYHKLLEVSSYGTWSYYKSPFCKNNIYIECDSNGSKSSYGHVLHSYIWMAYRCSTFHSPTTGWTKQRAPVFPYWTHSTAHHVYSGHVSNRTVILRWSNYYLTLRLVAVVGCPERVSLILVRLLWNFPPTRKITC
jgi:hypothetical protein